MRMGVTTRDVGKVVTVAPISVRTGITANSATTANPTVGKQRLSGLSMGDDDDCVKDQQDLSDRLRGLSHLSIR